MDNKTKYGVIALLLILLISSTSAYYVGQIITQNQLNNFDLDEFDFNLHIVSQQKTADAYQVVISGDSLERNEDGTYTIVNKNQVINYWLDRYYLCRKTNTSSECRVVALKSIKDNIRNRVERERNLLKSWQEELLWNEFSLDINREYLIE